MNRFVPLTLAAVLILIAGFFLFQPDQAADPSGAEGGTQPGASAENEVATGAGPATEQPVALARADGDPADGRTASADGEIARASAAGGAFQLRAVDSNGTPMAPATFLVLSRGSQIEWVERSDGILALADPSALRAAAVLSNGYWSLPWGEAQGRTSQDLVAEIASAHLQLEVNRDSGIAQPSFQVTWSFMPNVPDLEQVFAALSGADLESIGRIEESARLFHYAFQNFDAQSDAAQGQGGRFEITDLPPGPYQVTVQAKDCVSTILTTTLAAGERKVEPVVLEIGGSLDGRLVDEQGVGIADARVLFEALENELAEMAMDQIVLRRLVEGDHFRFETTTNAQGRFVLGPVPGRVGNLYASAEGFLDQRFASVHPQPPMTTAIPEAVLKRGGVLELEVLRASDQQPLAGAQASWRDLGSGDALINLSGWRQAEETTDPDGRVRMQPLPASRLEVEVRLPGYAPNVFEYRVEGTGEVQRTVILDTGLELRGRVASALSGEGIEGVELQLEADEGGPSFLGSQLLAGGAGPPVASSDEQGAFHFADLAAGRYLIIARHDDYATLRSEMIELVRGVATPQPELLLSSGASLTAVYFNDAGIAQADQAVLLLESAQSYSHSQVTDESGEATFVQLAAGNYQLMTVPEGEGGLAGLSEDNLNMGMTFVELSGGEHKRIEIGPGLATASLQGHLAQGGLPVGDTGVAILGGEGIKSGRADGNGDFHFEKIKPGHYTLFVGSMQAPSFTISVEVMAGDNQTTINLPGGRLRIRVVADQDGAPANGVPITLRGEGALTNPMLRTSDGDGMAEFEYLASGPYTVAAGTAAMPIFGGSGELGSAMKAIRVGEGISEEELRLKAGATFRVRVLGTDGEPVNGAGMYYLDANGMSLSVLSVKVTNSKGVAQLTGLPEGPGRILVKHLDHGQVEFEVNLKAGQTDKKEVGLETGAVVYIQVTDASDQPAPGVLALVEDARGAPISMLYTIADSQEVNMAYFTGQEQRLGPLAAGRYTVKLFRLGAQTVSHSLEVPEGVAEIHRRYTYNP